MRRNATCLVACILIPACSGCAIFKPKDKANMEQPIASLDDYTPPVQESVYDPDPYPVYGSSTQGEEAFTTGGMSGTTGSAAGSAAGPRYHTVVKKDTLYGLARMYYGDQRRWKGILAANRGQISDPNMIRVGQRLLIP